MRALAEILRARAARASDCLGPDGCTNRERADDAELFLVLARIIEGKPVLKAFGAPGDWGYGTEIGDALAGAYREERK
jgi:hypothetical protein